MKLGIVLPTGGADVLELVRFAEGVGADSIWVPDGFADGQLEAFTTMSAAATNTERMEVGAYMLNASLRDPALLAKMVATLDRLAPGRIRILLGTGWHRADYVALGAEFPPPDVRARRTRDAVSILKRETDASVEVAGVRDDVLELAAAEADGWALSADALDAFFERVTFLRCACTEAGRAFDELRVSCTLPWLDDLPERIADLAAHGMHEFRVVLGGDADRGRLDALIAGLRARSG